MSAISNLLNQIKTAIYGEQVRDAIHDSILQCYTDVTNAKTLADQSTTSANNAAASANSAATKANNAAASANSAAQSATTAANNANAAANNASNAKEAANSATSTATSAANQANDAASAANTAKTNADKATQAANTAAGAANTAAEAANTAATNANTAKDDAVAATEAVNAAAETINEKAVKNGTEPDLTAGTAEQLVSDETVLDTEPYKLRKTVGSGNRAYLDKIVGGTVCWNQLIDNSKFYATGTTEGYAFTNNGGGSFTIEVPESPSSTKNLPATPNNSSYYFRVPFDHKFIISDSNPQPNGIEYRNSYNGAYIGWNKINAQNESGGRLLLGVGLSTTAVAGTYKFRPQIFDLTQMFGAAIADAIYAMDQANAGAGVEWFRKIFPAEYYPYNAGELISVSGLSEHKTAGFNLWDEEWENGLIGGRNRENTIHSKNFCKILPNTTYYATCGKTDGGSQNKYYLRIVLYDEGKNQISSGYFNNLTFTTPKNAAYFQIETNTSTVIYGNIYNHDICINLSDPSRNGEYEPYAGHSYPLDSSVILRGIPKLDAENNLYYDGDEYQPDGKVSRRYGIVDLGTLTWETRDTGNTNKLLSSRLPAEYISKTGVFNWVSDRYSNNGYSAAAYIIGNVDNVNTGLYLYLAGENETGKAVYVVLPTQETKPSGYLIYELATPTEESAEPYAQIQVIDPAGTEEFVSESILPVGHETRYMVDLKDRLEHLPDPAANDGLYAIQQTDGKMELVNATFSPGVVENASGAIASFSDGADNVPVKNLVVNIEPVQAGSGDPSPDNVRPISGWTGVKVSRAGINIWDEEWEEGTFNTTTGVNIVYSNQLRSKNIIKIKPNTTYFWNSPVYNWIIFYDKYGNVIEKPVVTDSGTSSKSGNSISVSAMHVFTTPANAYGTRFYTGTYNVPYKNNIGINYPSTDTDYHPGYAKTYDISLPSEAGTVYGGTLDVVSGVLTVDRIEWTAPKTGWQTYSHSSGKTIKYHNLPTETIDLIPNVNTNRFYSISDTFSYYTNKENWYSEMPERQYVYNVSGVSNSKRVWICYEGGDFEDVVEGAKFIFMIQNSITYTLTASEIRTLLGENNIFADAGDVNVDYIADTKLYIDKKFTELQALVLENVGG